ncbi:MAG: hypothetical protein VXZ82_17225 [Planctomycetota bacterium]|nr:hypothetical protein [Planctomycetota bacterium]
MRQILTSQSFDYTFEGGWRFRVQFQDGMAANQFVVEDTGEVSNQKSDIPYQARMI